MKFKDLKIGDRFRKSDWQKGVLAKKIKPVKSNTKSVVFNMISHGIRGFTKDSEQVEKVDEDEK